MANVQLTINTAINWMVFQSIIILTYLILPFLRIISGTHKSRSLYPPKNLPVRPTTDFAKESLFNILNNNFDFGELKVLDLFSGTGNISYEFASRGFAEVTAIESNYNCYSFIKKTIDELHFKNVKVLKNDVFLFLKNCMNKYDIIFADPPYEMEGIEKIVEMVFQNNLLNENGWLIIEHSAQTKFVDDTRLIQKRNYGKVNFSIFG